jgi:hypothetical protein
MIAISGTINWVILSQLSASLLSVVALTRGLKLGEDIHITGASHAKTIVCDAIDGFKKSDAIRANWQRRIDEIQD